jgi:hypothetical protein
MVQTIPGTDLLDPEVIAQPYGFYEELRSEAPVWEVPGAGIFTVATYQLLTEAAGRVEDSSSNLNRLLYKDAQGMPCRFSFGDAGVQALACHEGRVWTWICEASLGTPHRSSRRWLGTVGTRPHQRSAG